MTDTPWMAKARAVRDLLADPARREQFRKRCQEFGALSSGRRDELLTLPRGYWQPNRRNLLEYMFGNRRGFCTPFMRFCTA